MVLYFLRRYNSQAVIDLINPTVPVTDAENIHALDVYFKNLNLASQRQLCSELILAVVVSAGAIYAQQRVYKARCWAIQEEMINPTDGKITQLHGNNPNAFHNARASKLHHQSLQPQLSEFKSLII